MSEQNIANSSANKRIARNSIFMSIRMVFLLLISLYTTRAVIAALGVEDYGIYNVVCGFVAMFSFLSNAMNNGIQRFYNYELGKSGRSGISRVYNTAIRVQCAISFILFVIVETIGLWYISNKMVIPPTRLQAALWVFQFSVISFIILIIQVPYSAAIIAAEKMDFYAIVSILTSLLVLLIAFAIKNASCDRLILYGMLFMAVHLIVLLIYFMYSRRLFSEIKVERTYDKSLLKSMLGFSGWNLFGAFGGVMKDQGVNMILNLFFGPVVNAARGVAVQVNGGLQGFVSNLNVAVRPQVTKSYAQGDINRVLSLTYSISKLSNLILFIFSLPVILEIHYILRIWLGNNIPEHTEAFILIIIITSFANNLNAAVSGIVHSSGKMKTYQLVGAILNLICLPVIYFFLQKGASSEFALTITCVDAFIVQIGALIVLKQIIDYRYIDYIRYVILPFIIVVLISLPIPLYLHNILQDGTLRFFVVCAYTVLETILFSYLFGLNKAEKKLTKKMFLSKIERIYRK